MSTSIETPILTPTSINSLPIEIKAQIVKLADLQDENYRMRSKDIESFDIKLLKDKRWRAKSLNALFLVNKEWSNLAAVHLFQVLVSQELDSVVFKYSILFHRNHFIKTVDFLFTQLPEELLRALANLPNVDRLGLSAAISRKLFGNLNTLGNSGQTKFDQQFFAFRTVGARITKLHLHGFDSIEATKILSVFPNVTHLTLIGLELDVSGAILDLGNVLATSNSLQTLLLSRVSEDVLLAWKDLVWNSSSSLDNLTIDFGNSLDVSNSTVEILFDFCSIFSTSLKSLTINISAAKDISLIKPFIHLQHLTLFTKCASIPFIINSFSKSPIISLFIKTMVGDFGKNATHLETTFILFVNQHSSLQYLEFKDRFNRYNQFPNLVQLCAEKRIHLVFSTWDQQYLSKKITATDDIDYRKPVLKEAFQFGQMRLLELEKENDIEGMTEMFDNCKWLRASAAERKD